MGCTVASLNMVLPPTLDGPGMRTRPRRLAPPLLQAQASIVPLPGWLRLQMKEIEAVEVSKAPVEGHEPQSGRSREGRQIGIGPFPGCRVVPHGPTLEPGFASLRFL